MPICPLTTPSLPPLGWRRSNISALAPPYDKFHPLLFPQADRVALISIIPFSALTLSYDANLVIIKPAEIPRFRPGTVPYLVLLLNLSQVLLLALIADMLPYGIHFS